MSKSRWEEILEEYEVGSHPDITHDAVGMAQRIAELEQTINKIAEPEPDEWALNGYANDKKEWIREETLNHNSTMMLKPFLESVEQYQKEVHCNGKDGIASHNLQSKVYVKVVDPRTGDYTWNHVKWIEPTRMMGCGCWDGILIVAEMGD